MNPTTTPNEAIRVGQRHYWRDHVQYQVLLVGAAIDEREPQRVLLSRLMRNQREIAEHTYQQARAYNKQFERDVFAGRLQQHVQQATVVIDAMVHAFAVVTKVAPSETYEAIVTEEMFKPMRATMRAHNVLMTPEESRRIRDDNDRRASEGAARIATILVPQRASEHVASTTYALARALNAWYINAVDLADVVLTLAPARPGARRHMQDFFFTHLEQLFVAAMRYYFGMYEQWVAGVDEANAHAEKLADAMARMITY